MRLIGPAFAFSITLIVPTAALASPFTFDLASTDLLGAEEPPADTAAPGVEAGGEAGGEAGVEAPVDDPPAEVPTEGDPAEAIGDPTGEDDDVDPLTEDDPTGDEDLDDEEGAVTTKKGDFNAHGIGARMGLNVIPSWVLTGYLSSHTNSLCRDEPGDWGTERGLSRVDGCNFYVGGEYIYRQSRILDIVPSVGYYKIGAPDGYWLDNGEWDLDTCTTHDPANGCDLGGADYTELDFSLVFVEVDFIARGTLFQNQDVEVSLGGGGGVGIGILVGDGLFQTPLGTDPGSRDDPNSCQTLADLSDFTKCTPRYYDDPDIDQDGDGFSDNDPTRDDIDMNGGDAPGGLISGDDSFAQCTKDGCNKSDLNAFGSRIQDQNSVWPVYPIINLMLSFRVIIKDTLGLNLTGGWNTGFYFGGGVQYFFGGGGKDK